MDLKQLIEEKTKKIIIESAKAFKQLFLGFGTTKFTASERERERE
jgi:hypothetical protein